MIQAIRQIFGRKTIIGIPAIPAGERIYAIGDVHGRADLLEAMIEAIELDDASAARARSTVILLGDLVDRGPDSAKVLNLAKAWQEHRQVRILCGNHEEMFLESFRRKDVLQHFLRFGGRETLLSYGIQPRSRTKSELEALQALMAQVIPEEDLAFMRSFEEMIVVGDYAFVHAGIAPEVALKQQKPQDLRWIREPFLSHEARHSHVIIHGHTIYERAEVRDNRIGIDTGAFESGRLTALVLEGTGRRFIETKVKKTGEIRILGRNETE